MSRTRHLLGGAALLLTAAYGGVAAAGSTPSTPPSSAPGTTAYSASIVRDDAGVPHITADDWGSLGFGQGWALSEDRACTLLDQIVKVRGERAKWFGPGEHDANINSDFAYRHLGLWDDAPTRWADQPARVQDVVAGYVAGVNAEIAANGLAGWCAGEDWAATTVTTQDLYAYVSDILLLASSRNFIQEIGSAVPPAPAGAATSTPDESTAEIATTAAGFAASGLAHAFGASNGWALGADRSTTAGGLLLANPHFPWEGELRFWESHLTIPGELNVYGVTLSGLPGIQIGFNEAVAWTHTVSAGHRFTLYRYDLTPDDPTVYLVDGQPEAMVPDDLTIEVRNDDGSTSELTRTLYSTKHGPVVSLGPLTWTSDQAFADRRRQPADHEGVRAVPRHGRRDVDGRVPGRARQGPGHPLGEHHRHERRRPGVVRRHGCDAKPVARGAGGLGAGAPGRRAHRARLRPSRRHPARRLRLAVRLGRRPCGARPRVAALEGHARARTVRLRVQRQRQPLARQPRAAVDRLLDPAGR